MDIIGNSFCIIKPSTNENRFDYLYQSKSTKFYHHNFLKVQFDSLQNLVRPIFNETWAIIVLYQWEGKTIDSSGIN